MCFFIRFIKYNTNKTISRLQKDVEEALAVASKRLLIRKSREKSGGKIDDSEVEALKNLKIFITKKQYTKGCLAFLKSSLSKINNLQKELKGKLDKSTMNQIRSNSRTLREIKEFSEGYTEIIKEMKIIFLFLIFFYLFFLKIDNTVKLLFIFVHLIHHKMDVKYLFKYYKSLLLSITY